MARAHVVSESAIDRYLRLRRETRGAVMDMAEQAIRDGSPGRARKWLASLVMTGALREERERYEAASLAAAAPLPGIAAEEVTA